MSKINAQVLALAEVFGVDATVENGVVIIPTATVMGQLPEGLTEENVKAYQTFRTNAIAAATKVVGEKGLELAKSDANIKEVTGKMDIGGDVLNLTIARSKTYPGMNGGDPITKHGVVTADVVIGGRKTKSGQLGLVVAGVREAWAELAK